jgi:protein O-GlcNAc transferase
VSIHLSKTVSIYLSAIAIFIALKDPALHRVLGTIYMELNDIALAQEHMVKVVKDDPSGYVHNRLIGIYYATQNLAALKELLIEATRLYTSDYYASQIEVLRVVEGLQPTNHSWQEFDRRDLVDAAIYLKPHIDAGMSLTGTTFQTFDLLAPQVSETGLILEFGVRNGHTIHYIAELFPDRKVYGFDSFEGLPEPWHDEAEGSYTALGRLPKVPENVEFVVGWFNDTLPKFKQTHLEPIAFMNVDCDIYSATKTIFDELDRQIIPGTVIVFDEYIGSKTWQIDEFKAFQEWVTANSVRYEYLAASFYTKQAGVRIISRQDYGVNLLQNAHQLATKTKFPEFLSLCSEILDKSQNSPDTLLSTGSLLQSYGYLSQALNCYKSIPNDPRALVNMANIAREQGNHDESIRIYEEMLEKLPDNPVLRRNYLVSLEYDPDLDDKTRFKAATQWGTWADKGCHRPVGHNNKRPRIGYVSADLCQHTVGLFLKDVIKAHSLDIYTYHAGKVTDWVTREIQKYSEFRDVSTLDDNALAGVIRKDKIDILVDLSGHTAGSRLTVFAYRPAPVQISWLGYFATTGLKAIDAVLLDNWHAPPGTEEYFVEKIIRLPSRFSYTPVPFAPEVSDPPYIKNGYITFGSFNNTAKYNKYVYKLWNQLLEAVPGSRLILKWRTFQDVEMQAMVKKHFTQPDRAEFRGASFHKVMLAEYADIDIALDPFPFTGGLTTCEALWMGVPVVTYPGSRVVSRQGLAVLSAIGLPDLAAKTLDHYVETAVSLAQDPVRLKHLRSGMRKRMKDSMLMDVKGFACSLEKTLRDLYSRILLTTS